MTICPLNAPDYGTDPLPDSQAADWCRRVYRSSSKRYAECKERVRLGVGVKREVVQKEQGRMWG